MSSGHRTCSAVHLKVLTICSISVCRPQNLQHSASESFPQGRSFRHHESFNYDDLPPPPPPPVFEEETPVVERMSSLVQAHNDDTLATGTSKSTASAASFTLMSNASAMSSQTDESEEEGRRKVWRALLSQSNQTSYLYDARIFIYTYLSFICLQPDSQYVLVLYSVDVRSYSRSSFMKCTIMYCEQTAELWIFAYTCTLTRSIRLQIFIQIVGVLDLHSIFKCDLGIL